MWNRELGWWVRRLGVGLRRAPGRTLALVGVAWLWWPHSVLPAILWLSVLVALRVWQLRAPVSYCRWTGPLRGMRQCWRLRRRWRALAENCGLSVVVRPRLWQSAGRYPKVMVPSIAGSRVMWPHVQLSVRPLLGQTVETFEKAAEALRTGTGASRLRVEPSGPSGVLLRFTIGDELRVPFTATVGQLEEDLSTVVVGRREDGHAWRLPVGPQTLVAGCSGSGKGSVFWSFVFALAPAVKEGRVRLHGIDLKGGMEIAMGDGLFTTTATTPAEAVALLELLVGWMRERTYAYAGRIRSHTPSVDEPLEVVMVDELAALTAYCSDRDLQRRAEAAINLLCSQGRAPGFMVFACLQDPRKEVIPSRGLFTQMVGLRLKDLSETSMVLGDAAMESGAWCHRITRDVPGTGYVLPEDGSHPVRVRAGYASDEAIRSVAGAYATSTRIPVEVPDELEGRARSRPRKTRPTEAA